MLPHFLPGRLHFLPQFPGRHPQHAAAEAGKLDQPVRGSYPHRIVVSDLIGQGLDVGVRILNFSRADLAVADDIKAGLASGKIASYVTDFPTEETVNVPGIVAIPHLGASTEESEDNCAVMAAKELIDFLETGNIRNSVNYPDVSLPHTGDARICIFHKNIPGVLNNITAIISSQGINVENMINKSKKDFAYTILEIGGNIPDNAAETIASMESVIRVNIIK